MKFHFTRIAMAVGALAATTSAFADPTTPNRPPANYSAGTTDVFLAGSSAVDLALTKFIANTCVAGSLDTYRTDAGGKTYYLWTCETAAGSNFGLSSGNTKIAIHKNTNSSSDGTNLVANGAAAALFLQVSDLNSAASQCAVAPTVVPATATIPTYNAYVCGTTAGNSGVGSLSHTVRLGFSDSEPKQFNAAVASQLTTAYPLTIIFGVPVTKNVRDALQTSQGLASGDESEANMPTLSSGQINSIFTGRTTNWSQLGLGAGIGDDNINVVRRSNGSGTTRAFDATFMGDFCVPGLATIAGGGSPPALVTTTIAAQCTNTASGGGTLWSAGTSDDLVSCLNSYQVNGAEGAIGYLSTDYQPAAGDSYRWVKVDGYSPKLLNVANGKWHDWSEESLNYNKATALAGDDLSFYNAIKATSNNGTLMSEIAQNLTQTTSGLWNGGVMGALAGGKNASGWGLAGGASLTTPRTDASVLAYPANPFTHGVSSGYNLCAPAIPAIGYTND